jgi:hypothetical protein
MIRNRKMTAYIAAIALVVASEANAQAVIDGTQVSVPPEQKLESPPDNQAIVRELIKMDNHQATPKGFKPEVGAPIPRDLHLSAFPPELTEQMPSLKNLMYAHLDKNIVIIDALYSKVEAVVPLPDALRAPENAPSVAVAALNRVGGLAHISPQTKHDIFSRLSAGKSETTGAAASTENARQPLPQGTAILAGARVPETISLTAIPENVSSLLKQRELFYALLQDRRLLIAEPNSRQVIGVILPDEGATEKKSSETRDPLKHLEEGNSSAYTAPNEKR